jgi:rare lipoprotein A (peptidoglycan hydrolase)
MTRREAATWALLFLTVASAVATGIVTAALILGTLSPVAASRSSQLADSPILPGGMTTERPRAAVAGQAARTERPEPVALRTAAPVAAVRTPSPSASSAPAATPVRIVAATERAASATATLAGLATWYCLPGRSACTRNHPASGMYAAAGPALRVGDWRDRWVTVSSGGRSVRVQLVDWCACSGVRVIDLYSSAMSQLAPLSRGVIPVTVTWREP